MPSWKSVETPQLEARGIWGAWKQYPPPLSLPPRPLPVPSPPLTKQLTGACASHPQSHPNGSLSSVNKQEHLGDFGASFCGQSSLKPSVHRIHPLQMYTILAINSRASSSRKRSDHGLRDKKAEQVGKDKRPSILPPLSGGSSLRPVPPIQQMTHCTEHSTVLVCTQQQQPLGRISSIHQAQVGLFSCFVRAKKNFVSLAVLFILITYTLHLKSKLITVWGTMVRSDVCNSWCPV